MTLKAGDKIVFKYGYVHACTVLGKQYVVEKNDRGGCFITCKEGEHGIWAADEGVKWEFSDKPLSPVEQYIDRELGRVEGEPQ